MSVPLMTAEEFAATHARIRAELVRGVVVPYPPWWAICGFICPRVAALIGQHVDAHDLGHTMCGDVWVLTGRNPDTVRCGDILYFSYERLPRGPIPDTFGESSPDLIVEVKSPPDPWSDLHEKIGEYLDAGVRVVAVIEPASKVVLVHRSEPPPTILQRGDTLTIPDVLPGFSVPVARLFA